MQRFLPQIRQLSTSYLCNLRSRSAIPRPTFNRADNVEHTHVNSDVGYRFNYHKPGDRLPRFGRQKDEDVPELQGGKPGAKTREVDWTFGANDYIDILGNGSVHPAHLLHHVPPWLRAFPGKAPELVRLIHYRNLYQRQMERSSPKRWHQLQKRIKFLLTRMNYRKQDEIGPEYELGLWKEKPDYDHKDRAFRSYEHHHR